MAAIRRDCYLMIMKHTLLVPATPTEPEIAAGLPALPVDHIVGWQSGGWSRLTDPDGRRYAVYRIREVDGDPTSSVYLFYAHQPDERTGLDLIAGLVGTGFSMPAVDVWREASHGDGAAALALSHMGDYLCNGEQAVEDLDLNGDPLGTFTWVPFTQERKRVVGPTVLAPPMWPAAETLPLAFDADGNTVPWMDVTAVLRVDECHGPDLLHTMAGYDAGGGEYDRAVWTSSPGDFNSDFTTGFHKG